MQSVDLGALKQLRQDFGNILEQAEGARKELHEQLAQLAKKEVDAAISTRLNDSHGLIRGWQAAHVGSRGGYAAVRAIGKKEGASSGNNSPGAITNYLEGGHRNKKPRQNSKYYRFRAKSASVNGRHFYLSATAALDAKAIALAGKFADELAKKLGGG